MNYVLHSDSMVKFMHGDSVYDGQKITPAKAGGTVEGAAAVVGDKLVFTNTTGQLLVAPTLAGVAAAPLVIGSAAGGVSATTDAVGAGAAAAAAGAGVGLGLGLSSGKSGASGQ